MSSMHLVGILFPHINLCGLFSELPAKGNYNSTLHENLRWERNYGTYEECVIMLTSNDRDNHGDIRSRSRGII